MLGSSVESTTFKVGDRVQHRKDYCLKGRVAVVEDNNLSVMVAWDRDPDWPGEDNEELDFQWSYKLVLEK